MKPSKKRLIERVIKRLLTLNEETCPYCGSSGAYVGFSAVECPNPKCDHYMRSTGGASGDPRQPFVDFWGLWSFNSTDETPWIGGRTIDIFDVLKSDFGFFVPGGYDGYLVSPDHWTMVPQVAPGQEDYTVAVSSMYDYDLGASPELMQAISPEAQNIVKQLNSKQKFTYKQLQDITYLPVWQDVHDAAPQRPDEATTGAAFGNLAATP